MPARYPGHSGNVTKIRAMMEESASEKAEVKPMRVKTGMQCGQGNEQAVDKASNCGPRCALCVTKDTCGCAAERSED